MKYLLVLVIAFFFLIDCKHDTQQKTIDDIIYKISGDSVPIDKVDSYVLKLMDSLKIPAISMAIINEAEIVYHRTFGVTNTTLGKPISGENLFDAGSLSKTPFAYVVMKMVNENQLELDKPLYQYLPYPDIEDDKRYELITARMVLSHSTGFPNWRFLNDTNQLDIKFTPGSDFRYSGEGYEYLANVLAHINNIEKDSLEVMMQHEVFKPFQMNKSTMVWNDKVALNRVDGYINGEMKDGWGINQNKTGFYASYSLQTEALDYARFLTGLMKSEGLDPEYRDEMLNIQIKSKDSTKMWGLGIEIETLDNGKTVYKHGGFNNNFSSGYLFSKGFNNGYVFFTNSDTGYELNHILQEYFTQ